MAKLPRLIFPHLEDHRIQSLAHPADGAVPLRLIGTLIQVIRVTEDLLCFLKPDASLGVLP